MKKTLIALALALAALGSASAGSCYSEGVRVGSIQKFSQKGFVNKSWEGELVMEGFKLAAGAKGVRGGDVWAFSVLDANVAKVIDGVVMTGGSVAVRYCQANPYDPTVSLSTDTEYRITQAVAR